MRVASAVSLSAGLTLAGLSLAPACSIEGPEGAAGGTSTGAPPPEPGPTERCEVTCAEAHPSGEADYRTLRRCLLCDACATRCGAEAAGLCADLDDDICGMETSDCEACVASACASAQNPDTTFAGECAGPADTCSRNSACVSFNNCVAQCVSEEGVGGDAGR